MCFAVNKISKMISENKTRTFASIEECQDYTGVHVMPVQYRRACIIKRDKKNCRVIDPDS